MRKLQIGDRTISDKDTYVIAEIGCNHGGSVEECARMINKAAECGADAVKLQARNIDVMFTKKALEKPYDNEYSCGKTYGEHRRKLDYFGKEKLIETRKYWELFKETAKKAGVLLFATPMDEDAADFLNCIGMPVYKIASCDVKNIPLVKKVAGFGYPLIISTGGANIKDISRLVDTVYPINKNLAVLHCVSTYPNTDQNVNLKSIEYLRDMLFDFIIGFSSHHPGILPIMVARSMGASIFEVHFTMDRGARGTDHGFSMEPAGLRKICHDVKRISTMTGQYRKTVGADEVGGFINKMGKSIYPLFHMGKGEIITKESIACKSPAIDVALPPSYIYEIVGKTLVKDVSPSTPIKGGDFV